MTSEEPQPKKRKVRMRRTPTGEVGARHERLGKQYGVTSRTIRKWEDAGVNADDPASVASHLETLGKPSVEALDALRKMDVEVKSVDATLSELQQQELRLGNLARYYYASLEEATKAGRMRDVNSFSKLHERAELGFRNCKLAQARLGIEGGELLTRKDFEKIMNAFFSLSVYGVRRAVIASADKIAGTPDPAEVCRIVESGAIEQAYVSAWESAINRASELSAPEWVLNCIALAKERVVATP